MLPAHGVATGWPLGPAPPRAAARGRPHLSVPPRRTPRPPHRHLPGLGAPGTARIQVEAAREGRRTSTSEARMHQGGKEVLRVTATFADLDQANGRTLSLAPMPDLPAPDDLVDPWPTSRRPALPDAVGPAGGGLVRWLPTARFHAVTRSGSGTGLSSGLNALVRLWKRAAAAGGEQ
ncbi:acyl-CoA thioesterase domain-containing protein [Actinomadura sp. 21ATH]|uniref:acyl-CoA thioesterase domain-containing protein n=1 Tax=Actinomadura sp. 21ATH TaxID=1735444 RepID=UPI0035BF5A4B